ncbi:unnamed protein product, partial [Protopolystoma xenopodis]
RTALYPTYLHGPESEHIAETKSEKEQEFYPCVKSITLPCAEASHSSVSHENSQNSTNDDDNISVPPLPAEAHAMLTTDNTLSYEARDNLYLKKIDPNSVNNSDGVFCLANKQIIDRDESNSYPAYFAGGSTRLSTASTIAPASYKEFHQPISLSSASPSASCTASAPNLSPVVTPLLSTGRPVSFGKIGLFHVRLPGLRRDTASLSRLDELSEADSTASTGSPGTGVGSLISNAVVPSNVDINCRRNLAVAFTANKDVDTAVTTVFLSTVDAVNDSTTSIVYSPNITPATTASTNSNLCAPTSFSTTISTSLMDPTTTSAVSGMQCTEEKAILNNLGQQGKAWSPFSPIGKFEAADPSSRMTPLALKTNISPPPPPPSLPPLAMPLCLPGFALPPLFAGHLPTSGHPMPVQVPVLPAIYSGAGKLPERSRSRQASSTRHRLALLSCRLTDGARREYTTICDDIDMSCFSQVNVCGVRESPPKNLIYGFLLN